MKLPGTFFKLPFRFDAERLRSETDQFAPADWSPHPQGFAGNDALILVSVAGGRNDEFVGEMKSTAMLDRCPSILKDRSANGTSASDGRVARTMRSNSRDWLGWMRRSLRGAEELPIHAQGRVFLVGSSPS